MGFVPSVPIAFGMLMVTMIAWGSWTNTQKKTEDWRFEAYYWDYAWSIVVSTFILSFILGGVTPTGWSQTQFIVSLATTSPQAITLALFSGIVWGIGNLLLVNAIALAGMTTAFPISIGLALVLGTFLAYITNPSATQNPGFLFLGLFIVTLAVLANAFAYKSKEKISTAKKSLKRGLIVSLLSGLFIALFAFPFNFAFELGMTGYTGALFMTIGGFLVTTIMLPILMRKPLIPGVKPIGVSEYVRAKMSWHVWAVFGGFIWSIAGVFNLVVSSTPDFSVAVAYTLGNCAPMVAALWGVFVWKEFKGAPKETYLYIDLMFGRVIIGSIILE